MGIIDRIKRRLPIIGSPPPQASARPVYRPVATPEPEPEEEASPRGNKPVATYIEETVKGNSIVLFMKGSPSAPQCGFSATAAGILGSYGRPFHTVNVIADPDVREGVKQFTNWPTIPQVFVGGEFIGGADILQQMHASGDLKAAIEKLPA